MDKMHTDAVLVYMFVKDEEKRTSLWEVTADFTRNRRSLISCKKLPNYHKIILFDFLLKKYLENHWTVEDSSLVAVRHSLREEILSI